MIFDPKWRKRWRPPPERERERSHPPKNPRSLACIELLTEKIKQHLLKNELFMKNEIHYNLHDFLSICDDSIWKIYRIFLRIFFVQFILFIFIFYIHILYLYFSFILSHISYPYIIFIYYIISCIHIS